MSNLEDGKEGFNKFTKLENFKYKIYAGRKNELDSLQLNFGSFLFCESENINKSLSLLKHNIKQFFSIHQKDGYYKKRNIFIPHIPDAFYQNGKGYCYFELFLFLEETYDKKFVFPYIKELCEELDNTVISKHTDFKFHKVKSHKLLADS